MSRDVKARVHDVVQDLVTTASMCQCAVASSSLGKTSPTSTCLPRVQAGRLASMIVGAGPWAT